MITVLWSKRGHVLDLERIKVLNGEANPSLPARRDADVNKRKPTNPSIPTLALISKQKHAHAKAVILLAGMARVNVNAHYAPEILPSLDYLATHMNRPAARKIPRSQSYQGKRKVLVVK